MTRTIDDVYAICGYKRTNPETCMCFSKYAHSHPQNAEHGKNKCATTQAYT